SDNAESAVTYTSISSDLDRPSWGIPLMNVDELSEMDPYEEVAQQGHVPPLSPAYVPDPMELDEHVPVYVLEPKQPKYHAPSYNEIQVEDQPHVDDASPTAESPGYMADSDLMGEDDDEDLEENPSKEHEPKDDDEDPEEDPKEENEPEEEERFKGSDKTEPFKEDETAALIDTFTVGSPLFSLPPTSLTYDQASLGHKTAMIHRRDDIPKEDIPPRRRFVFTAALPGCHVAEGFAATVDIVEAGQGLIHSPGAALTWWNGHVRILCHDAAYAMTWGTLKKKLTDKYSRKGEIKKFEIELWNLRIKGNDVAAYTQRFQ
nr:hypothetical protein [Tanacetum cinerariifolium]